MDPEVMKAAFAEHRPMGVDAPQWCEQCSSGKVMADWVAWPCPTAALLADWERRGEALRRVLTEAGMQAHKHGCPNRLIRPAQWDEHKPCAGCEAEAAIIDTVVAKEG